MSFTGPTLVDAKSTDTPQSVRMFEMLFADDEVVETPPKPKKSKLTIKCGELDIPPSSGKCADATKSEPVVMPMPKKDAAPDPVSENMSIWDAWLKETSVIDAAPKETCVIDATPKKTSVKDAAPDVDENSSVKDAWLDWACGKSGAKLAKVIMSGRRKEFLAARRKEFLAARAVQNSQKSSCVDDSSDESDSDASTNAGS